MKKNIIITLTSILCILLIIVALSLYIGQMFLHGCLWWECVSERNFHVHDIELPSSLFPEGALVGSIGTSSEGAGEIERGFQSIFWPYGGAGYSIKRFPSNRKAISDYQFEVNHMLDFKTNIPWGKPTQLTFHSSTADDTYIACGIGVQGEECGFTGRYQEYVIYFSSSIGEGMTFEQFEEILRYIDEQISRRLYP